MRDEPQDRWPPHPETDRSPPFRWRGAVVFICGVAPWIAGCGGAPDPPHELATLRSWVATAALAAESRRDRATTVAYTAQLRDRGYAAMSDTRRALSSASLSGSQAAHASALTDSLRRNLLILDALAGSR